MGASALVFNERTVNWSQLNRRGIALASVIFMIVVVGGLAAGALYVGTQDQRSAENTRRMQQSFSVAEQGAFAQLRGWNNNWSTLATYPTTGSTAYPTAGNTAAISQTTVAGLGAYTGTVYHIGTTQYLVDITGLDPLSQAGNPAGGGARKRVGLLVRALPGTPTVAAAYTTRGGSGHLRGGYTVDGDDTAPPNWSSCPTLQSPVSGFATNDTSAWKSGSYNLSGVDGGPPAYKQDASLTPAKMDTIGNTGITYDNLVAMSTITLGGGSYTPAPVTRGPPASRPTRTIGVLRTHRPVRAPVISPSSTSRATSWCAAPAA
jgi:type II secretory pathway pseudopilin PulG